MKNCVWIRPQLFAQFEFTEWTPDGQLRHSKFVGLRVYKGLTRAFYDLGDFVFDFWTRLTHTSHESQSLASLEN